MGRIEMLALLLLPGFYLLGKGEGGGGRGGSFPPKVFREKKLKAVSNTDLIRRRYKGISEGCHSPEMRFQQILNILSFQNFSGEHATRTPLEGLKNFSLRCVAPRIFSGLTSLPSPQTKNSR